MRGFIVVVNDPRLSIEERYRGLDDCLQRVRSAAMDMIRGRFLLQEDLDHVLARAKSHWDFATRERAAPLETDDKATAGHRPATGGANAFWKSCHDIRSDVLVG
jgi:hypothetical protein